jgi:peroxiredoxin
MLNEILASLRRARQTSEVKAAYEEFLRRLDVAEVAAGVRREGEAMPSFLLPNAEGGLVDSADLLAQGPLVLTFIRGSWCPYCSATLDALEAALPELQAAGGTLAALTPETGGRALAAKRERGLRCEVLVDVDLSVAMQFGVVFRTPPLYVSLLRRRGIDLAERSGNPGWLLPIPATFVVSGDGVIRKAWADVDFTRRAEPAAIVQALHGL